MKRLMIPLLTSYLLLLTMNASAFSFDDKTSEKIQAVENEMSQLDSLQKQTEIVNSQVKNILSNAVKQKLDKGSDSDCNETKGMDNKSE